MDIFKLIYEHDLRLDDLRKRHTDRNTEDVEHTLEDLLNPDPTYSKFYLTGTRLQEERFGLNRLKAYPEVIRQLQKGLDGYRLFTEKKEWNRLSDLLEETEIWEAILLTKRDKPINDFTELHIDSDSNVGHRKKPLREALMSDELVLYKENAHHGFDLHLFSKSNIYRDLFHPLKELISGRFRFFSINGKRIQSERKFYFETWALDRPPHGIEEVFEKTVL